MTVVCSNTYKQICNYAKPWLREKHFVLNMERRLETNSIMYH